MSYITRTPANSTLYKTLAQQQARRFTIYTAQRKSAVDRTKEVAHDVNIKAGKGADKILEQAEKGVNEAYSVKHTYQEKGAKGAAEQAGHDANIAAGQGLAKGIEAVESVVQKTKEAIGIGKKRTSEVASDVSKEASHVSEKTKGKAEEVAGKARQSASNVTNKL